MKAKFKILLVMLVVVLSTIIFNNQEVYGVGQVYYAWRELYKETDKSVALVYRTYTSPHKSLVRSYSNAVPDPEDIITKDDGTYWEYKNIYGNLEPSKWVNAGFTSTPSIETFLGSSTMFHSEKLCTYTENSNSLWAYTQLQEGDSLSLDIATVSRTVKNCIGVSADARYNGNYESSVFYRQDNYNGQYVKNRLYYTGLAMRIYSRIRSSTLRYSMILMAEHNCLIEDNVLYPENTQELLSILPEDIRERGWCYVSSELVSKMYGDNDLYDVTRTSYDFVLTDYYSRQIILGTEQKGGKVWGLADHGKEEYRAMGSIWNLYDNIIYFPEESNREIIIRHINLEDETVVNEKNVSKAIADNKFLIPTNEERHVLINNGTQKVNGSATGEPQGYQEYYKNISITSDITKNALEREGVRCLGYNIAVAADMNTARTTVATAVSNNKYEKSGIAKTPGKEIGSNDDKIVIEFYYTEAAGEVEINHYYVDENNKLLALDKQTIIPNTSTKMKLLRINRTINRTNSDTYIKEVYVQKKNGEIEVHLAKSLKEKFNVISGGIKFAGYETFNAPVTYDNIKNTVRPVTAKKVTNYDEVITNIKGSIVQVNLYYVITTSDSNENHGSPILTEIPEPPKEPEGNVFVVTNGEEQTYCMDNSDGSYSTVSIPSGTHAKVGIENIQKYMAGAIRIEHKPKTENKYLDLKFTYKMGNRTQVVDFGNVLYNVGYDVITDVMIYRLTEVKIEDAGESNRTRGTSIFDWGTHTIDVPDKKSTELPVSLKGIANKTIQDTDTSKHDINNYVQAFIIDKFNTNSYYYNKDGTVTGSKDYTYTYLTVDQLNTVDSDKDGDVDTADITDAKTKMDNAETLWEAAKVVEATEKAEYEAASKALTDKETKLGTTYRAVVDEANARKRAYQSAESAAVAAESACSSAKSATQSCKDSATEEYTPNCSSYESNAATKCADASKKRQTADSKEKSYNNWIGSDPYDVITDLKATKDKEEAEYNAAKTDREEKEDDYYDAKRYYYTLRTNYPVVDGTDTTQGCYDSTKTYCYKAKYDEYVALVNKMNNSANKLTDVADLVGLKVKIDVKNMEVKINNKLITTSGNNLATSNYMKLSDMLNRKTSPIVTSQLVVNKNLYKDLDSTYRLQQNFYNNQKHFINPEIMNGVRVLAGDVEYITEKLVGNPNEVKDTAYTGTQRSNVIEYFPLKAGKVISEEYTAKYEIQNNPDKKYEEVHPVNIYTPIRVESTVVVSDDIVDQTGKALETPLIQVNTPFDIIIGSNARDYVYSINNTNKFNLGYYIKFSFDVHKVKIDGVSYKHGEKIPANTWIGILKLTGENETIKVSAQAYGDIENNDLNIVNDEKSSYTIRAAAYNADTSITNGSKRYLTLHEMLNSVEFGEILPNICWTGYLDEAENEVIIINRMYDFKVTDLKDVEWKNTFRVSAGSVVNKHSGKLYYSGITKWDTDSDLVNKISSRTTSEIGKNPLRILPLGSYKNSDITKISAPKMGYRFSYELKITGAYYNTAGDIREDKKINIQTKFYYISKDGKTFIEEYTPGKEGIYLLYKDAKGNYVRINDNGGNYNLTFTPNDGYRYIANNVLKAHMSKKAVSLGNLRNITLTYNMAAPSINGATITYYGEYKLPNSTIAVKVDRNGKYDVNNALRDGYIGVIFDISTNAGRVTENGVTKDVILKYGINTKTSAETDKWENTSQWDYEGYLGFTNYGNPVTNGELSLRLEKGTWKITDAVYNKIKGTVILYDMDDRAATDYE